MKKVLRISILLLLMIGGFVFSVNASDVTTTTEQPTTTTITTEEFNVEEAEDLIANVLEEHFGWLLAILGISAATLAGIVWGIVKAIFWLKRVSGGLESTTLNDDVNTNTGQLLLLTEAVNETNKTNALNMYIAEALDLIITTSHNDNIVERSNELHNHYLKALLAKDIDSSQAKDLANELKSKLIEGAQQIKAKATSVTDDVISLAEKVKAKINSNEE